VGFVVDKVAVKVLFRMLWFFLTYYHSNNVPNSYTFICHQCYVAYIRTASLNKRQKIKQGKHKH